MASFPEDLDILLDNYSEEKDPSARSTAMERGPDKTELINQRVSVTLSFEVLFESEEAANAFDEWYLNDIKRIGYFDFVDPRSGKTVSAHFPEGKIGALTPLTSEFHVSKCSLTVEYRK